MLRTLAVTTDFSDASRESFEAAASLAKTFDARLYVLHVAQDPQVVTSWQMTCETPAESKARRMTLEKKLEELVQNEGAFSRIRVEPRVVSGPSANALHEFQVAEKVDLFLTATHGYWGIKHFLLGSFAAKILRVVSCPALVRKSQPIPKTSSRMSSEADQWKRLDEELRKGARTHGFGTGLWILKPVASVVEAVTGVRYHEGHSRKSSPR